MNIAKKKKSSTKKPKQKEKHLVNLKREKALAGKGWKVARTTGYLKKPKKAIGKKGYPYAVLNKKNSYETFYTWKEKPSKERKHKSIIPKGAPKTYNPTNLGRVSLARARRRGKK